MKILKALRRSGFTLIELAVALAVVTLILGSILVPLTTQVEQRQISDTRKTLEEIKEALIGFAIMNGRLPCPAQSSTNGLEKAACTALVDRAGFIPSATLGVSKLDAWGHIFRYSVTPDYAKPSPALFTLTTARDMTVQTRTASGGTIAITTGNDIPAVVLSHGKNGYGSFNEQGIAQVLPADWPTSNQDEQTNAMSAIAFVSRAPQAAGLPNAGPTIGGEFDDIVVWISPSILFNRMVAAGKLP